MKAVLISDLHSQSQTLVYLKKAIAAEKTDAIICCGDITNFGDSDFCDTFLKALKESGLPSFVIWGNADYPETQKKILASPFNSHLTLKTFANNKIFGIGYVEDLPSINGEDIKGAILITHPPPAKKNLEEALPNAPKYHISGHLHDAKWVKKYPATTHIQVPTLQNGEYGVFDLETGSVDFKKT